MKKDKANTYTFKQNVNFIIQGFKVFKSFPKPVLLSKTISSIFNAGTPFINIYFSAKILNELASDREPSRLIMLVLLTIGLNLVIMLLKCLISRWNTYCNSNLYNSLLKIYSDKQLSMDFIDIEDAKIQQQYDEIYQHQNGMGLGLWKLTLTYDGLITGLIQIIISLAMAFTLFTLKIPLESPLRWLDSPIAIITVCLILVCSILIAPYLSIIGGRIWAKASNANNKVNRIFSFYNFTMINDGGRAKDIRIYDQKRLIDKGAIIDFKKTWGAYYKYDAKFNALGQAVTFGVNGLIYLFVALKAFAGAFGVGNIVQYVGSITQFSNGFSAVLSGLGELWNNNPHLDMVFTYLDIPNKMYQGTLAVEKRNDNDYELEFKNVSFLYPGSKIYAIKNLSMRFKVGQRIAIVGQNGSGKTTMIKLLCRLYDPTEGVITLNGLDIKKYKYDEYMAIFSVVFQDFKLLPFTLGQNVAADVDYDNDKVIDALTHSGFSDRLDTMPKMLETYLYKNFEEDGVELSGGEAQKVALARALYKGSPFIILDEPTAALDPIAEFEVYTKFNEIVGNKTAVYISHRLASCRFCDEIVVFNGGELVQCGSHDDLILDEDGKYYEMWTAQAQYYNEKNADSTE